jgi:hypothetical protein
MATGNQKLTEPLETTTAVFASLFAAALIVAAVATLVGTGTLGGLGHAQVCVTDPNAGGSTGASPFTDVYTAKPGAQLPPPDSLLSACATHPLGSLVTPRPEEISSVPFAALRALVPVPALAGATLLTFARIVRRGAAMDDELKGTV